ncbi:MAG: DVUA0089 family protein [Spirochaetales bacterium]|jgi:hypothetical protein|nr:DVUA0089 family protein [Spirochaetales bacterium]
MKKRLLVLVILCLMVWTLPAQSEDITDILEGAADSLSVLIRDSLANAQGPQSLYLRGILYNNETTVLGEYFNMIFLKKFSELGVSNINLFGPEVRPPAGGNYYTIEGTGLVVLNRLQLSLTLKKQPENQTIRVENAAIPHSTEIQGLLQSVAAASAAGGDAFEPNNTSASAYPLNPGRYQAGFSEGGDQDWFSFQLTSEALVTLGTEGILDTTIELFNSSGTSIGSNDDGGEDYNARLVSILSPGTYRFMIKAYSSETTGNYTFFFETGVVVLDTYEPNNSQSQAKTWALSQGRTLSLSFLPSGDQDWFKLDFTGLTISPGSYLSIWTSSDMDTRLDIYQGGNLIAEDDDGGEDYNASVSFFLEGNLNNYYVFARPYSESTTGPYQLTAEIGTGDLDAFEPNNTPLTATPISLGQLQTGHRFSNADDVDWFVFVVSQAGTYSLGTEGYLDTVLALFNDINGNSQIAENDDGPEGLNSLLEVYLAPGTYYAQVREYSRTGGDYSFFVRRR